MSKRSKPTTGRRIQSNPPGQRTTQGSADLTPGRYGIAALYAESVELAGCQVASNGVAKTKQAGKEAPIQPTLSEAMKGNDHAKKGREENRIDNGKAVLSRVGSNSATYLTARLNRDHPDIAIRLQRGPVHSVPRLREGGVP